MTDLRMIQVICIYIKKPAVIYRNISRILVPVVSPTRIDHATSAIKWFEFARNDDMFTEDVDVDLINFLAFTSDYPTSQSSSDQVRDYILYWILLRYVTLIIILKSDTLIFSFCSFLYCCSYEDRLNSIDRLGFCIDYFWNKMVIAMSLMLINGMVFNDQYIWIVSDTMDSPDNNNNNDKNHRLWSNY